MKIHWTPGLHIYYGIILHPWNHIILTIYSLSPSICKSFKDCLISLHLYFIDTLFSVIFFATIHNLLLLSIFFYYSFVWSNFRFLYNHPFYSLNPSSKLIFYKYFMDHVIILVLLTYVSVSSSPFVVFSCFSYMLQNHFLWGPFNQCHSEVCHM